MADGFPLEVLLPTRSVVRAIVSEAVLPAEDGEVGILAGHENFIGVLGTGPLKYVENGDDFWLMVSSGLYKIIDGALTILAEAAEQGTAIELGNMKQMLEDAEKRLSLISVFDEQHRQLELECHRIRARLEVYRRTSEVN